MRNIFVIVVALVTDCGLAQTAGNPLFRQAMPGALFVPVYEKSLRKAKISGDVTVKFDILRNGLVTHSKIVASEPNGIFDQAVLDALVSSWFIPAFDGCRTLERKGEQRIHFDPNGNDIVKVETSIEGQTLDATHAQYPIWMKNDLAAYQMAKAIRKNPASFIHPDIIAYKPFVGRSAATRFFANPPLVIGSEFVIGIDGKVREIEMVEFVQMSRRASASPKMYVDLRSRYKKRMRANLKKTLSEWRFTVPFSDGKQAPRKACQLFFLSGGVMIPEPMLMLD